MYARHLSVRVDFAFHCTFSSPGIPSPLLFSHIPSLLVSISTSFPFLALEPLLTSWRSTSWRTPPDCRPPSPPLLLLLPLPSISFESLCVLGGRGGSWPWCRDAWDSSSRALFTQTYPTVEPNLDASCCFLAKSFSFAQASVLHARHQELECDSALVYWMEEGGLQEENGLLVCRSELQSSPHPSRSGRVSGGCYPWCCHPGSR